MKFKKIAAAVLAFAVLSNVAAVSAPGRGTSVNALPADGIKYEFEDAELDNCSAESWEKIDECASGNSADIADWSGTGFANLTQKGSSITVTVNVEKEGLYELVMRYCQAFDLSKKVQYLNVNGVNQGEVSFPYCEKFQEMSAGYVPLKAGKNEIQIKAYWGYTLFDYMVVKDADPSIAKLSPQRTLVNKNASDTTKRLYNYLCDIYGKNILSGQQEYCGEHSYNLNADPTLGYIVDNEAEFNYIKEKTGKMPAVRGIDFLNYSSAENMYDDHAAERAAEWANKFHGIVTLSYHWGVPSSKDKTGCADRAFYVQSANPSYTTFSVSKALTEGTWENEVLMSDIKVLASKLKILKDADVPVLWRPLHEAEGAWFWWGAEGAENCKKLYYLLYDQLTNVYGLDNLIWVWTSSTYPTAGQWYPGDEYVDILGYDKYNAVDGLPNLSSISSAFYNLVAFTNGKKLVAMSENDSIPAVSNLINDKAGWLWFCPWYNNYLTSQQINPEKDLIDIYTSDYCITLDELPDFKTYPINGTGTQTPAQTSSAVTTVKPQTKPVTSSVTVTTSKPQTKPVTTVTVTTSKPQTKPVTTASPAAVLYGDVDQSGEVDLSDLVTMSLALLHDIKFSEIQLKLADTTGDGLFDITDLARLKQFVMKDDIKLGPTTTK